MLLTIGKGHLVSIDPNKIGDTVKVDQLNGELKFTPDMYFQGNFYVERVDWTDNTAIVNGLWYSLRWLTREGPEERHSELDDLKAEVVELRKMIEDFIGACEQDV